MDDKTYFLPGKGNDVMHVKFTPKVAEEFTRNIQNALRPEEEDGWGLKEIIIGVPGVYRKLP